VRGQQTGGAWGTSTICTPQGGAPAQRSTITIRFHALAILSLACGEPDSGEEAVSPAEDMRHYRAALRDDGGTTAEQLDACLAIGGPTLQGDCAVAIVRRALEQRREDPALLCPRIPEGAWRWECWFLAAEHTVQQDRDAAVGMCERAGHFRQDCLEHLWLGRLKELVHPVGPQGFARVLPEAERHYRLWSELLEASPEQSYLFWSQFYSLGLGPMRPMDLGVCEALPALHRERCLEAGEASFEVRLEAASRQTELEGLICHAGARGPALEQLRSLSPDLDTVPHHRLEETLRRFQQGNCLGMLAGGPPL
jgi:hypothetical protein